MTDLFVSATASLLVVLTLVRPTPPLPMPIQADLLAFCPPDPKGTIVFVAAARPAGPRFAVAQPDDLAAAPARLGLKPALLYAVAVTSESGAGVDAACFARVRDDLVRARNSTVAAADRKAAGPRAIFAAALAVPEAPLDP